MKGLNKYSIFFALFGFLGFKELNGDPLGLIYFGFFGQLSHIWWNKLGNCEDERLIYNKHRAGSIAFYTGFVLAVVASLKRKIKRLEEENKELKEQLKVNYAEIYKQL